MNDWEIPKKTLKLRSPGRRIYEDTTVFDYDGCAICSCAMCNIVTIRLWLVERHGRAGGIREAEGSVRPGETKSHDGSKSQVQYEVVSASARVHAT
jgi:hypothetical protein